MTQRDSLLEACFDAVIVFDEYGKPIECNDAAVHAFGWAKDEFLRQPLEALVLSGVIEPGMRRDSARRCDGSVYPCDVSITQIQGVDPVEFLAIIRDRSDLEER